MKLHACSKTYENRKVLDFPGMELEKGRIYAIIGSNGSGKSTFGKMLSGILPSDQKKSCSDIKSIGYMPQKNFAFRMSTRKNILQNANSPKRADQLMQKLHLQDLSDKRADRLSGGETARMALARLMMRTYDLVILDEPTAAMDMETSLLSENLIREYVKETDCAMLLITHSLSQARRLADQVLYFHEGKLAETGPAEQLLHAPATTELKRFLDFYGGY